MKTCNKCERDRPISQYTPDKRNKDGLQSICNDCRRAYKIAKRQLRIHGVDIHPVKEKTCNKCGATKISEDFFRDSGIADGRSTICKACKQGNTMEWRARKREEYNEYMRQYRRRHPAKYEQERNRGLKVRYGISLETYNEMLSSQDGKCAICSAEPKSDRPLVVDHHHGSKKVRGLLCYNCNREIALLDRDGILDRALAYINKRKD
jgi:hypothetical protein